MRNAMSFPNRILYREELLSTTVTYAVDLSETEFLHLKPIVPIEQLGIRPAEFRLIEVAEKILERYAIHELHYLASVNADIQGVQYLVENWDYREVGHITIGGFRPGADGGYAINDGNHRCAALALLLATDDIIYQPVTAIAIITQTNTINRVYEHDKDGNNQTCSGFRVWETCGIMRRRRNNSLRVERQSDVQTSGKNAVAMKPKSTPLGLGGITGFRRGR